MTNKRKFKHWDNDIIFHTLQKVIQIKNKIEEVCVEKQTPPQYLDMSMLPSDVLYDIVACFEAMHDKLLEEELITSGYLKSKTNYQ